MEANEAVAVAGMTKPKPLPNELLSDLSVSLSTKLQCFRVSLCCDAYILILDGICLDYYVYVPSILIIDG